MSENFARLLEAGARSAPGALALSWDSGTLTWAALDLRAGGVARALSARGVRAGETVVVSLPNGWPFAAALWGALKLGATVTPLNPLLTGEERMRIVEDLRPAAIVEETGADEAAVASVEGAGAPALILYTSGSTGEPKGVVLSHEALTFANRSWIGPVMGLTAADVVLAALPLSHSFGLNGALLAPLLAGASVVLLDHFSPEAALGAIAHHRVTVFPGVAAMFRRMLDAPAMATADLGSLRAVVSGAAPCPWELAREWRERTGVRIIRGYGSTELFRPISHLAGDPRDEPESVGRPVPGVEIAVVDEAGRALPRGEGRPAATRTLHRTWSPAGCRGRSTWGTPPPAGRRTRSRTGCSPGCFRTRTSRTCSCQHPCFAWMARNPTRSPRSGHPSRAVGDAPGLLTWMAPRQAGHVPRITTGTSPVTYGLPMT